MPLSSIEVEIYAYDGQGQEIKTTRRAAIAAASTVTQISSRLANELGISSTASISLIDQTKPHTRLGMTHKDVANPSDTVKGTDGYGRTMLYKRQAVKEFNLPNKGIVIKVVEVPMEETEEEKKMMKTLDSFFPNQPRPTPSAENISSFLVMPVIYKEDQGYYDIIIGRDAESSFYDMTVLADSISARRKMKSLPDVQATPGPSFNLVEPYGGWNLTLVETPETLSRYESQSKTVFSVLLESMEAAIHTISSSTTGFTLHFDGATCPNPGKGGMGVCIKGPDGETIKKISEPVATYPCTNNEAEYFALNLGLETAVKEFCIKHLQVYGDSELVINQINETYKVKNDKLKALWDRAKELISKFDSISFTHVPRDKNKIADGLAKDAANL